ncbi:MAG: MBL fold metallo-hydrolase, partial [Candidatus Eremiobacteraeota bacterium]|nr:MBL fold metallo-hydrolase [Candidatus Eremiobacteraeota bacterium]
LELASPASRLVGYTASVYLTETSAGRVLVDTGPPLAWGALRRFLATLGGADLARAVQGAIVTHQHEDHAGNVARLARSGVPLAMGAATRAVIEAVTPIDAYRRFTWGAMSSLQVDAPRFDPAPLVVVPTPGHTSDHHAVWDPEHETLFGGDLFLGVKVRIAHPTEDLRALARSLRTAAALRPRQLFDSHRGLVDEPVAALEAKAAWLDDTVGAVERLLDAGWSERRVRSAVLGGESAVGWLSRGEYSRAGFVRAVRRTRPGGSATYR